MSGSKRRLSDEVEQGRQRTTRSGATLVLHCFIADPHLSLLLPSKMEEEGTSSSLVHELAQVIAQEVQETSLPAPRVKPKTRDTANTCHILSVENSLFSREFQLDTGLPNYLDLFGKKKKKNQGRENWPNCKQKTTICIHLLYILYIFSC